MVEPGGRRGVVEVGGEPTGEVVASSAEVGSSAAGSCSLTSSVGASAGVDSSRTGSGAEVSASNVSATGSSANVTSTGGISMGGLSRGVVEGSPAVGSSGSSMAVAVMMTCSAMRVTMGWSCRSEKQGELVKRYQGENRRTESSSTAALTPRTELI